MLLDLVNRPVFYLCFKLEISSDGTLAFHNEVVARTGKAIMVNSHNPSW